MNSLNIRIIHALYLILAFGCDSKMRLDTTEVASVRKDSTDNTNSDQSAEVNKMSPTSDKVLGQEFDGASLYMWSQVSGPGKVTFDSPDQPTTKITADLDGDYMVRLTAIYPDQEKKHRDFPFVWDTTAPKFNSLVGANEAADKVISTSEIFSENPLVVLDAADYSEVYYTRPLPYEAKKSCSQRARSAYTLSAAPLINSLPEVDGTYIVCVLLIDDTGNASYGESDQIARTTAGPGLVAPPLVAANSTSLIQVTADGAGVYNWNQVDGPGPLTINPTNSATPSISATVEGTYHVTVEVTNAAGNRSSATITFVWDVTPPSVQSFLASGIAANGSIKAADANSAQPLFALVPSADTVTVSYSAPLNGAIPQTCDGTAVYNQSNPPSASSLSADGSYVICAKLIDAANNVSYALSPVIIRDTIAPIFTSLAVRAEAADTYINAAERNSTEAAFTLSATGMATSSFTGFIFATGSQVCDGNRTYNQSAIPAINAIPMIDGDYFICAKLADAAGNVTYGKSAIIHFDVTPPSVNAGPDVLTGASWSLGGTVTDAAIVAWTKSNGTGTITFSNASTAATQVTASADGAYTLTLTATDAAGNSASDSMNLTWDATPPVFTSLTLANGASDGFINASEAGSTAALFSLNASGYTVVDYSVILSDSPAITCNGSQTYSLTAIPAINSIPAIDGTYALCVRLADAAGNTIYGKSSSIVRDATAPIFTSLNAANGASDGYINNTESSSTAAIATLSGSGYTGASYTALLDDSTPVTCDAAQSYSQGSIPAINSLSIDGTYALCVKLTDAAGNITYGKSTTIIRDTVAPVVNAGPDLATNVQINTGASVTGATSFSWSKTSGVGTITFGSVNAMNTSLMASADGAFTLTLTASDDAGNSASDTMVLTWDATAPVLTSLAAANQAADGFINGGEVSSSAAFATLTASGYTSANYSSILDDSTPITCDGTVTYGQASIPAINTIPAVDSSYALCVKLADAVGNVTYGKSSVVVRDATSPIFTSLALANGASDGSINNSEASSTAAIAVLTGSGYANVNYTSLLDDSIPVTCNGTQTYGLGSIPAINSLSVDGVYALCVKLSDAAGNVTYGKSPQVTRDTAAPVFTSLLGVNGASDGYVNGSEYLSVASLLNLVASGYSSVNYTNVLVDSALTCNAGQTYGNATIPLISDIPGSDNSYAVCVKLSDAVGNITYGKSQTIVRDITAPIFTSLVAANGASDGYVNSSEAGSALAFANLSASGQSSTNYSAILVDSPVTCDGGQSYSNSSIPTISSMGADNTYALCVKLADAAGNITYGKSSSVVKDTVAPTLNAGVDIITNAQVTSSASASGATTYSWSKTAGAGTITFGSASALNTTISASAEAAYTLTLTATDAAGNSTSDSLIFTWDTTAPTFTSLLGANEASDGYINASETSSALALLTLNASGQSSANYTAILNDATPVTCDGAQTYGSSSIPLINTMPASDSSYAVCVKLTDGAGNISYGKSQVIIRDTVAPVFTSLNLANEAVDGYISSAEASSSSAFATLSASGYTAVNYTAILNDATPVTCDGSQTYSNGSIPAISTISATNSTYALCVKLADTAGNITYGKSAVVTKDTVAPTFTSLSGANGASDGYVNGSEYLSPASLLALTASGYTSANYTAVLLDSALTCNASQTYSNSSIPLISDIPGSDASYAVCVKLVDAAGNISYGKSQTIVRDIVAPVFTSLVKANEASDGYVNSSETSSANAFAILTASGQSTTNYTGILADSALTCDGSKTYSNGAIPAISTIPAADGAYALCVKLADAAGNITYGKSDSVTRDTNAPAFTSLNGANEASDGTIMSTETASTAAIATLSASGWTVDDYTDILLNNPSIVCDGSKTYGNGNVPQIYTMPATDEVYAVCVRLADAAGNISYGKSQSITRDTTPPAAATITGAPTGVSRTTSLNITIGGSTVSHYKYKVGVAASTDCTSATGYSSEIAIATAITDNISALADGDIALCVVARDSVYNWMAYANANSAIWTKDVNLPDAPTSLTLTPGNSQIGATYAASGVGTTSGYLIVQSTSAISWTPTQGSSYSASNISSGTDIIYVGTATSYTKTPTTNGQTYYYKVWAYNTSNHYSLTSASSSTQSTDPQQPLSTIYGYSGSLVNTTSIQLGVWGTSVAGTINYEFQIATNTAFSTGLVTQNVNTVASGNTALSTFSSLTNGTVYFWRARLFNGTSWSSYTSTATFKVDTSINYKAWQVDTKDQFDALGTYTDAGSFTTNSGEVYITNGAAVDGYYYTNAISLSNLGWSAWGAVYWEGVVLSNNSCNMIGTVQYWDGAAWTDVSGTLLPNNTVHLIPLGGLDPTTYNTIRIKLKMHRNSASTDSSPIIRWIRVTGRYDTGGTLSNGGFDSTVATEWTNHQLGGANTPSLNYANTTTPAPQGGTKDLKFNNPTGNLGQQREAWAQQTFNIPAGATQLKLYYQAVTSGWGGPLWVYINGTQLDLINPGGTALNVTTWTLKTYNISAYAGQTVTVTIGVTDYSYWAGNGDHGSWYGIDTITVQ